MNEPTASTIPTKPASELANVGGLNHVTPRADTPAPHPAPAAAPAPGAMLDDHQVAWDSALHESPPKKSAEGRWTRKRGNGARVAAGKSIFVPPPSNPKPPTAPGAKPAPAAAAPAGGSVLNIPGRPAPGAAPGAVPLVEIPEAMYEDTAKNLADGLWGFVELAGGKEWKGAPDELEAYKSAFRRLWHQNQWPRLGPWISLVLLIVGSLSRRREAPATKKAGSAVMGFFRRLTGWRSKTVELEKEKEPTNG